MNTDLPWYDRTGLHTYAHTDEDIEHGLPVSGCVRHPETGEWYALRNNSGDLFTALWDDGMGEPVIPCPGDHVAVPEMDSRGFVVSGGWRLADSVAVRREDLEDQPSLLNVIRAEQQRAEYEADPYNYERMREMMYASLTAHYEPTGLILHPEDHRLADCVDQVANTPGPYRRSNQMRVADAFGIPHWMAGVDGAKAPLRLRARWAVRSVPRRLLTLLPLVTFHGPRETGEGWMNAEPAEPRVWMLGAHVGNYRIGTTPHDPWNCGDDDCTEDHA